MKKWAVRIVNGVAMDRIVYTNTTPPPGYTDVPKQVQIGDVWIGGTWTKPVPAAAVDDDDISAGIVWTRLNDAEQDVVLSANSAAAQRFKFAVQANVPLPRKRLRAVLTAAFGAERATEILR